MWGAASGDWTNKLVSPTLSWARYNVPGAAGPNLIVLLLYST